MHNEDLLLLQELKVTRNLQERTVESYYYSIKNYTECIGQSMSSLLDEAAAEEEIGVRWKNRKLRQHLLQFRVYLLEKYEYESTAKLRFRRIKSIYLHYEIELQPLPPISRKNTRRNLLRYEDLPTKELLKKALDISDIQLRAIILFMCSSGTSRKETTSLTIQDFIDSTREYHSSSNIYDVLVELDSQSGVVPTWKIHRWKTNKDYYTFSTDESTRAIVTYLQSCKRQLKPDSLLFDIRDRYLSEKLRMVNDKLGLGFAGSSRRLRPHMLRKWNASQLAIGNNALTPQQIDSLQGRSKESTQQSYFLDNPSDLKKKYIANIDQVTILEVSSAKSTESTEYKELLRKYEKLENEMKEMARNEVRTILEELGYKL